MMLGKKSKSSSRKILIGMLLRKASVRHYILGVGNLKKMLKRRFLSFGLNLGGGHLTKEEFEKKVANEKNTLGLRLIPLYIYPSLPIGITLTSIGGEERVFDGSNIDTDIRFGCLAWGIKPKKD